MKKSIGKGLIIIIIIAIIITNILNLSQVSANPLAENGPLTTLNNQILQATVQITLWGPPIDEGSTQSDDTKVVTMLGSQGLGTLVRFQEQTLIITHDHWSRLDGELSLAEFYNTQNELIVTLSGERFKSLIRYRDGGTIILQAPEALAAKGIVPATIQQEAELMPGSIVYLTHHSSRDYQQVEVISAVVESISTQTGLPILNLRSLDGQTLIKGDSGGGIWWNGQLVGNTWKQTTTQIQLQQRTIFGTQEFTETRTDTSIAAKFPLNSLTLTTILTATTLPEITADFPS